MVQISKIFLAIFFSVVVCVASAGQVLSEGNGLDLPACAEGRGKVLVYTAVWGADSKSYIRGLTSDKFRITEDETAFEILCFTNPDGPMEAGIVLDFSSSISKTALTLSMDGLRAFIDKGNPENTYFAVGFRGEPFTILDPTGEQSKIDIFLNEARRRERKGLSSLNDALAHAVGKFTNVNERRKILIVLSDGGNNSSSTKVGKIRKILRDANIRTYIARIIDPRDTYDDTRIGNEARIRRLAIETRGGIITGRKETGMSLYLERLSERMRNEYTIGFTPREAKNKWRSIVFAVKVPKDFERITTSGAERIFY